MGISDPEFERDALDRTIGARRPSDAAAPPTWRSAWPSAKTNEDAAELGLVGRDAEIGLIAELLAGARRQRSGVLVLTGGPGIGKSALLAWAVAHAGGMRMLSARGVESEADLPFAGLSELRTGRPAWCASP